MEDNEKNNDEKIEELLKEFVENLNDLPTDVLEQLLQNIEDTEAYNKAHPEEFDDNKK